MEISRRWIQVLSVIIVAVCIFGAVHFSQQAATEKQRRKGDQIAAELRTQNATLLQAQTDVRLGCQRDLKVWNTFQRLIIAATHPPSLAGEQPTPQLTALSVYRQGLIDSVGDKPVC